jgi:hypothetical protein
LAAFARVPAFTRAAAAALTGFLAFALARAARLAGARFLARAGRACAARAAGRRGDFFVRFFMCFLAMAITSSRPLGRPFGPPAELTY